MMRESSWFVLVGDAVGLLYSYMSEIIIIIIIIVIYTYRVDTLSVIIAITILNL